MYAEGGFFSSISWQPKPQLSSFLYHLKEERILMKIYIYRFDFFFLYWGKTSPNSMTKAII